MTPLEGRRILVVEDEYLIAEEVTALIQAAGATVLGPVSTVVEALDLMETEAVIDCAVLDMNINGEKVFPVADALASRNVPFVFTTGYGADSIPPRYAHVALCEKPLDITKVPAVVASLVVRRQATGSS